MFEINLVPEIKGQMIKAQKVRNLVLFICIIASVAAIGVILILLSIKGGQDIAMTSQQGKIDKMSKKIKEFNGLEELLTIKDQLGNLSNIDSERQAVSRVFSIIDATLPKNADTVTLSSLSLDLTTSTLTLEGQANAGVEPYIDYRVLESYKKSVGLIKYDYGDYVNEDGTTIPAYCIEEKDETGSLMVDEEGNYYAEWNKTKEGCNLDSDNGKTSGGQAVRVYRTPLYDKWYQEGKMNVEGKITGVAHFESSCKTYSGTAINAKIKWTSDNRCNLAVGDGMTINSSSNGRDSDSKELVLRFGGVIEVDPSVFVMSNHFMTIIGPEGQNVTDSYLQVDGIFAERADDCEKDDTACNNTGKNTSGGTTKTGGGSN